MLPKKVHIIFSLLLTSILFFCTKPNAQEYSYINYDIKDGLAGSNVYDIVQDHDGFMWFATENGLSRFDGKQFKNFTVSDGLPDNEVLRLFVDSKNRLWIIAFKNAICYYYKGEIYNQQNNETLQNFKFNVNPFCVEEDRNGSIIITESNQYHLIYSNKKTETINRILGSTITVGPAGLDAKKNFQLYVGMENMDGAGLYLPSDSTFTLIQNNINLTTMTNVILNPHCKVLSDIKGVYYVSALGSENFILPRVNSMTNVDYLSNHSLAVCQADGVELYDIKTKKMTPLLSGYRINSSFIDQEGNYWFATKESGVIMIPSLNFKNITSSINTKSLPVFTLLKWNEKIIIGSAQNRIWQFDPQTSLLKSLKSTAAWPATGRITSIIPVIDEKLIIGTDAGLSFNFNTQKYLGAVKFLFKNNTNNSILVSTNYSTFTISFNPAQSFNTTGQKHIWLERTTCAIEKDSGYYIGTLNGLYYKKHTGDTISLGKKIAALAGRIVSLALSPDQSLWIATKGNGLVVYKNENNYSVISTKQNLTSDNCTSIHIDSNTIWLGTDKGVNRIEKKGDSYKVVSKFTMSDGLLSDNVNAITSLNNKIYIGTAKGLTYFEPDEIADNSACKLSFTGIYVSDKFWGYDTTNFSLPHSNNDMRFEFAGISFKSAGEMTYTYRLVGLHDDWRTTRENLLTFPTLPSGEYNLQIKATNKYGVESDLKEIKFEIQKLLWEKTGFKLLILFLSLAIIWLFVRNRIKKIRQKEILQTKINQQIAELEQKVLRSQMNPHFIFNSLNSIQQYVTERDTVGANEFITDFSQLIRMTLDLSSHSSINLADELKYIETYLRLEKTRLENQFNYTIEIGPDVNTDEIFIPPLLLQPFAENSIRHGVKYISDGSGLIKLAVNKVDNGVLISIQDNGIGRIESQKYKGQFHIKYQSRGMGIGADRIELANRDSSKKMKIKIIDLYNQNSEASGTRVDIYIPFQ